jgi:hypothetical protein
MFLAGLKFALGLAAGLVFLSGLGMLGLAGADLSTRWRKKRQRSLWKERARALRHVMPLLRERVVFRFFYRTGDWLPERDKSEHLQ